MIAHHPNPLQILNIVDMMFLKYDYYNFKLWNKYLIMKIVLDLWKTFRRRRICVFFIWTHFWFLLTSPCIPSWRKMYSCNFQIKATEPGWPIGEILKRRVKMNLLHFWQHYAIAWHPPLPHCRSCTRAYSKVCNKLLPQFMIHYFAIKLYGTFCGSIWLPFGTKGNPRNRCTIKHVYL